MTNVQSVKGGAVHKATRIGTVNGMAFSATKCFLNFVASFVETAAAVDCRTCNKV
jgi:hypothetical protein